MPKQLMRRLHGDRTVCHTAGGVGSRHGSPVTGSGIHHYFGRQETAQTDAVSAAAQCDTLMDHRDQGDAQTHHTCSPSQNKLRYGQAAQVSPLQPVFGGA